MNIDMILQLFKSIADNVLLIRCHDHALKLFIIIELYLCWSPGFGSDSTPMVERVNLTNLEFCEGEFKLPLLDTLWY
jgi:hypothetical protein